MNIRGYAFFAGLGLACWLGATLFYAAFGARMIEQSFWFYALNAAIGAAATAMLFRAVAKLTHINRPVWLQASLAFAAPGVLLGLAIMPAFNTLFVGAQPESLGRYGGYMLFGYAVLFASAFSPQRVEPAQ